MHNHNQNLFVEQYVINVQFERYTRKCALILHNNLQIENDQRFLIRPRNFFSLFSVSRRVWHFSKKKNKTFHVFSSKEITEKKVSWASMDVYFRMYIMFQPPSHYLSPCSSIFYLRPYNKLSIHLQDVEWYVFVVLSPSLKVIVFVVFSGFVFFCLTTWLIL